MEPSPVGLFSLSSLNMSSAQHCSPPEALPCPHWSCVTISHRHLPQKCSDSQQSSARVLHGRLNLLREDALWRPNPHMLLKLLGLQWPFQWEFIWPCQCCTCCSFSGGGGHMQSLWHASRCPNEQRLYCTGKVAEPCSRLAGALAGVALCRSEAENLQLQPANGCKPCWGCRAHLLSVIEDRQPEARPLGLSQICSLAMSCGSPPCLLKGCKRSAGCWHPGTGGKLPPQSQISVLLEQRRGLLAPDCCRYTPFITVRAPLYHFPQSSWTCFVLLSSGSWASQPAQPSSPLGAAPPLAFKLVLLPERTGRDRAVPLPARVMPLPALPAFGAGVGEVVRAGGLSHLLSQPEVPAQPFTERVNTLDCNQRIQSRSRLGQITVQVPKGMQCHELIGWSQREWNIISMHIINDSVTCFCKAALPWTGDGWGKQARMRWWAKAVSAYTSIQGLIMPAEATQRRRNEQMNSVTWGFITKACKAALGTRRLIN